MGEVSQDHDRLQRELSADALAVVLEREPNWAERLFGIVLEEELDRLLPLRREIEHGLASAPVTHISFEKTTIWGRDRFSPKEFADWGRDRIHELKLMADTAAAVLNSYLPQALGDGEDTADPLEIAAAARRLAQVWEDCARWTLRCRSVRTDPRAARTIEALSNINANMLDEIWEYGHTFIDRLNEAQEAHERGGSKTVDMSLTLTADPDEFTRELALLEKSL